MVGGLSSAGRAPALQAGGHRFDPDRLHHATSATEDEENSLVIPLGVLPKRGPLGSCERIFDIVNGFLIDAVAHCANIFGLRVGGVGMDALLQMLNLAEIIVHA